MYKINKYVRNSIQMNKYCIFLLFTLFLNACKDQEISFENPYSGGKEALGINFSNVIPPEPTLGEAGTVVTFAAKGLLQFKKEDITFAFNGEPAEIVSITENNIVVKIPESASSGAASISIGDQVFFGPQFTVLGKVIFNPFYKAPFGTNISRSSSSGNVNTDSNAGVVESGLVLPDGRNILVGYFTNYNNQASDVAPIRRIVLTTADGEVDRSYRFGRGANNRISTVAQAPDKRFYVAGEFSSYDKTEKYVYNITRTKLDGSGDSVRVPTYSSQFLGTTVAVPTFLGGTNGAIKKIFLDGDKPIAVGNFNKYVLPDFSQGRTFIRVIAGIPITTYKDSIVLDSTDAKQVIRFNTNGSLDRTYRFNTSDNTSFEAANGKINNAIQQADGKIIIVGAFTRFDGQPAGRIVRLNTDGTVDPTFNVGSGANNSITNISFSSVTKKFLITGNFGTFNGEKAVGLVMLNEDGSIDNSFTAKEFDNGFPYFAKQVSNGLIVVSGGFKKYDGVRRQGFIILTSTGSLAPGYNTAGDFSGGINDMIESRNADNKITLLLLGGIYKFDGKEVNNITSISLD